MSFQAARLDSQSVPAIRELPVADDEEFFRGALLVEDEYGEFVVVDTDVYGKPTTYATEVGAVALARFGKEGMDPFTGTPPFDILGGEGFPPGIMQGLIVNQGNRSELYSARYVGTLPTATGGSFGVILDPDDGEWKVDFDDDEDTYVRVESLDWAQDPLNKNRVVVSFLAEG